MAFKTLAAAALLVLASTAPAAAVATGGTQSGSAYTGTYVSFGTESDAVTNYSVAGRTVVESVAVQSTGEAEASGGLTTDADLAAVTSFAGAAVSVDARTETGAVVTTGSGAELRANDNDRGILVIASGSESQYVRANLSSDSRAETAGEKRVVVTKGDGTEGAFLVVGDGDVTVNEAGNVTAELESGSKLVYRQYADGRSESEKTQERLITSGTATAEVYYGAESSGSGAANHTIDVVRYDANTTVEVTERSANGLTMTVERSASAGKVVITSVSEGTMESTDDLSVTVDGSAAAKVDSYSELQGAIGSDRSAYLVRSDSTARASSDVVVAVNHFSAREVSVQSNGSATGSAGGDGTPTATDRSENDGGDGTATGTDAAPSTTDGSGPGFGVLGTVVALGAALFAARRRAA